MKRFFKWLFTLVVLGLAGWLTFAYLTSTNDCDRYSTTPANPIKAIVYCEYGPSNLKLADIEKPVPEDDQVLVKVHAASVNPLDWHYIEGTPYILRAMGLGMRKPKVTRLGIDYAGTVEAIGKNVTAFKAGDDVFGGKTGAFAEYVCVRQDRGIALKPAGISFEQTASVPIAGITALQALRDKGRVQPGERVLINGASGGVGTFAVQIAKSLGANVTGVCSARNTEMVLGLGADQVVDYTKEDVTKSDQRFDVILDNVGTQSMSAFKHLLKEKGRYVLVGGGGTGDQGLVGPLINPVKLLFLSATGKTEMKMMFADLNQKDLTAFAEMMQSGKVKAVIDQTFPLSDLAGAIRYLEQGHARGKVVIKVGEG